MQRNNLLITLLVVLIIVLGVGGYFIYSLNNKINLQNETINKLKKENEEKEPTKNNSQDSQSIEEKIKELFLNKLKQAVASNPEKVIAYKVDNVKILNEEEKKEVLQLSSTYKSTDILALVTYSVKPENISENTIWLAGNGEIEGEWVINKSACEVLRDGKLGEGIGTGW